MSCAGSNPYFSEFDGGAAGRRLQTLAYELTVAESRERQRVAQVLHDEIGQLLAMAQFRLAELSQTLPSGSLPAGELVDEVQSLLRQAAKATRTTTFELHPAVLRQLGLSAAIESLVQRLQRTSKLRVHLSNERAVPELPQAVGSVLLRTVRELALNAQRHAQAANLWISVEAADDSLRIVVTDDGIGFDVGAAAGRLSPDGGFGLASVEAQIEAIGGSFSIRSQPGLGSEAVLSLQVQDAVPFGHALPSPEPVFESMHP